MMEIYTVRTSSHLLHKDNSRNAKLHDVTIEKPASSTVSFQLPEEDASGVDFSSITPRALRTVALENFQAGLLLQETYLTLSEELPSHAIDIYGQVIDLTSVTDDTEFDFKDYYTNQFEIAVSIGDPGRADTLQSVLVFMET